MSKQNQNPESPALGRRTLLKGAATLTGGALLPAAIQARTVCASTSGRRALTTTRSVR